MNRTQTLYLLGTYNSILPSSIARINFLLIFFLKLRSKSAIARSLVKPVHLSQPKLDKKGKGRATTQDVTLAQDLRGLITTQDHKSEQGDNWGQPLSQQLSKKERRAVRYFGLVLSKMNAKIHVNFGRRQKQIPTAGPKWFNMPAQTMTPELKREIQAMRLRNALDPKRFYKGGAKNDKTMPEFFQVSPLLSSRPSAFIRLLTREGMEWNSLVIFYLRHHQLQQLQLRSLESARLLRN